MEGIPPFHIIEILSWVIAALFIPGFCLTLGLFPKWDRISAIERFLLSIFFGMIPSFLMYLEYKLFLVRMDTASAVVNLLLVSGAGIVLWVIRSNKK